MVNFKPTIITLVISALSVLALCWARGREANAEDTRTTLMRELALTTLPVDEVSSMTLERAGQPRMVFVRDGLNWLQVEPFEYPMDPYSIRQIALLARNLQAIDSIDPGSEGTRSGSTTAGLGLNPPEATVSYAWRGGEMTLRLGRRGVGGRAYLQRDGSDRVYVVSGDLHHRAIEMDSREWRDRRLFSNVSLQADRILRTDSSQYLELQRDGRRWRITRPVRSRVDQAGFDDFISIISRAQLSGFILDQPTDLAPFGLDEPIATLEITSTMSRNVSGSVASEPHTQRLLIGQPAGGSTQDHFAMIDGRPVVFRLSFATLQSLFRPVTQIAARTGSGVNPADVKSLVIRGPAGEFTLQRDLEKWIAPDFAGIEVQRALVEQLLAQLTQLKAPDVQLKPYPRELEVATVSIYGYDLAPMDTVRIAWDPERKLWALENGDNVLRVFQEGLQPKLTPKDFGLQSSTE